MAGETLEQYLARLAEARKRLLAKVERPPIEFPLETELPIGRAVASREFAEMARELRALESTKWFRFRAKLLGLKSRVKPPTPAAKPPTPGEWFDDYQKWIEEVDAIQPGEEAFIEAAVRNMASYPKIGIVASARAGQAADLSRLLDSLIGQFYGEWLLIVRLVGPTDREGEDGLRKVLRQRAVIATTADQIDDVLEECGATWYMSLDAKDVLPRHALFAFAQAVNSHPEAQLIYSDEDRIDGEGHRFAPVFKPDRNNDLQEEANYVGKAALHPFFASIGGLDPDNRHPRLVHLDYVDIADRSPNSVIHLPFVLLHAGGPEVEPREPNRFVSDESSLVSIVIPTRDRPELLRTCIESIDKTTAYRPFEYVIVDNGTKDKAALGYLDELGAREDVTVVRDDAPFNYSALNNKGAFHARGQILAFLNNDLEIRDPEWMTRMVSHAFWDYNAIVGTRLLYPDGAIQHAGIVVGMSQRFAVHPFRGMPAESGGYMGRANLDQGICAVTGACMFVRKKVFEQLGGLDEELFPVTYNDIDLCLKARHAGYENVYAGSTWCVHHESKTRGLDDTDEKRKLHASAAAELAARWGAGYRDPYYNPNLSLSYPLYTLSYSPRVHKPWYR